MAAALGLGFEVKVILGLELRITLGLAVTVILGLEVRTTLGLGEIYFVGGSQDLGVGETCGLDVRGL